MSSRERRFRQVKLPVVTERLALRSWRNSDVPYLVRHLNDPSVFPLLTTRHSRYRTSDEQKFVSGSRRAAVRGEKLDLAIARRAGGELIGGIGLEVLSWDNRRGRLGYWLAAPFWGKGYGSEAASEVCRIAFRTLRLHRVDAEVFSTNPASMHLLRKLGFRLEGKRREILRRDGRWNDEYVFGLLATEFRPIGARDDGSEDGIGDRRAPPKGAQ